MENILEEFTKFRTWLSNHREDYKNILNQSPYCISTSSCSVFGRNLVLFKYNQDESDFGNPFVQLCRGLILDESDFSPISFPFIKFHNYGEKYADKIDWNMKPYVLSKIDGSLIKIVRLGNELLISTNGVILADEVRIAEQVGCNFMTFGDLVDEALRGYGLTRNSLRNMLSENVTYMFELTSPWSRVVVPHKDTTLWFIGIRDNLTTNETFIYNHPLSKIFKTPELHDFSSFYACVETAKNLPWNEEGYVVTTSDFKRNKTKSLGYLSAHHLNNNGVMSYKRAVELVRLNEVDEVLAYFPEFTDSLIEIKTRYNDMISNLNNAYEKFLVYANSLETRKELALGIQKEFGKFASVGFSLLDKRVTSVEEWLLNAPVRNIVKMLGYKD